MLKLLPEPLVVPTETDRAYAAGILDGEGTIVVRASRKQGYNHPFYRLSVQVVNSHFGVIKWFSERWYASVKGKPNLREGYLPIHYLCWSGDQAISVLEDLLPYIVIKKEQALLAIEFQARVTDSNRKPLTHEEIEIREVLSNRMAALNHSPWPVRRLSVAEEATSH